MGAPPDAVWEESELIDGQDTNLHSGFLLAEEAALREYFSGIQVPKFVGNKQSTEMSTVPVYFRWPTSERNITYPYITLDLLSIDPAYNRWQSHVDPFKVFPTRYEREDIPGHYTLGNYYPDVGKNFVPADDGFGFSTGPYMPYDLLFQISVFSRSVHHDRFLISRFFVDFAAQRNFWIATDVDDVWHRCEVMGFVSGDSMETMEATKRQFRKIYTLRMETEIPSDRLYELKKVRSVNVKFFDQQDYLIDEFTDTAPTTP